MPKPARQKARAPAAALRRGTPRNLRLLARALAAGDIVGVPTETVYGLAGDALNPRAVRKIFSAKGRPANDPLIVHLHSLAQLDLVAERSPAVDRLAHAFWPGPLTLVLPKKPAVPALVTSGLPSVAVRMPRHPLFLALLRACGRPLAAPSANPFGYVSPTTAAHVRDGLGQKIRHILDGGECAIGVESTILDLRDPKKPVILRPGAIGAADIARVLRVRVAAPARKTARATAAALAPGLLARHYSPRTPIELHGKISALVSEKVGRDRRARRNTAADIAASKLHAISDTARPAVAPYPAEALLHFRRPAAYARAAAPKNIHWLTDDGDLAAAARTLFAKLRALDRGAWTKIHAERAPGDSALARAINDRLTRAAAKR